MREGLVISPADGTVSAVGPAVPPPELELGSGALPRVSIFMSVFNCHVNRAPVGGRITRIAYKPGLFLNADLDKASEDNERNGIVIDAPSGRFAMVQIAGLIARRIVCFKRSGEEAAAAAVEAKMFGSSNNKVTYSSSNASPRPVRVGGISYELPLSLKPTAPSLSPSP